VSGEMPKELDLKEVDIIYNDYIRVMTCMHEKLRALYNSYVIKFVDDKQKADYHIDVDNSRLILPGEDGDEFAKMFESSDEEEERKQEEVEEQKVQHGNDNYEGNYNHNGL
jgi:hypothetical protein